MKHKINDSYYIYKNLIVVGGAMTHVFYFVLDNIIGYADLKILLFRLICVSSAFLSLKLYKKENFQFLILILILILNMSFLIYLSSLSLPAGTGIIISLTMLSILPITFKRYLFLYGIAIITYIISSAIIVNLVGQSAIAAIVINSGSFFVILIIYLFVNKCRQLLSVSDKLLADKNNFLIDMYNQLVHDVKSPLTTLNFLSTKNESNLLSQATSRVEKIILDLKNETENIENHEFNILDRLDYLVSELSIRFHKNKSTEIKVNIESQLESNMVSFQGIDVEQFSRLISNLLNNSVEACSTSVCLINVKLKKVKNNIHIKILDNGPGVNIEIIDKIFDKKFTTKKDGRGLGLSAAKATIESSGGSLQISSGAGFEINLSIICSKN